MEIFNTIPMKTAESVSKGHPDKVCDQISDAILDACLAQDPLSRVAIETMGGHGIITVCGELTTSAYVDIPSVAKRVYSEIGYSDQIGVQVNVVSQSHDISRGVDAGGAGDQGIMVGYACSENDAMIPMELYRARLLLSGIPLHMKCCLMPDAKAQITLGIEGEVIAAVISQQHVEMDDEYEEWAEKLRQYAICETGCNNVFINATGRFEIGGFAADTGLTGRKLAVDNYGPQIPIGGGAFSGKDPSKVDRSAAYMARKIACDYVRKGSKEAIVKIAYSIGVAQPVMATVRFPRESYNEYDLLREVSYDLRPQAIIERLGLRKPIYEKAARNGHFGNNFIWDL